MGKDLFSWQLPQIRIAGPNSRLVKSKELEEGSWFLYYMNGDWMDLPSEIEVIVDECRMKAMDWIVTPPVTSLDEKSSIFAAIKTRSNADVRECQWGPEYSVQLEDSEEGRALLWLGNKSSRNLRSYIRVGGTYLLSPSRQESDDGHIWYVPGIVSQ